MQAHNILHIAIDIVDLLYKLAQPRLQLLDCFSKQLAFNVQPRYTAPLPMLPSLEDNPIAEQILEVQMTANTPIWDHLEVPTMWATLAAIPVHKSAYIKPVSSKILVHAQCCTYLEAFLCKLEKKPDTIHLVPNFFFLSFFLFFVFFLNQQFITWYLIAVQVPTSKVIQASRKAIPVCSSRLI